MNSESYNVYIDNNLVGQKMPLQFALIFVKAIYGEFYAEPELSVTIKRVAHAEKIQPTEGEVVNE